MYKTDYIRKEIYDIDLVFVKLSQVDREVRDKVFIELDGDKIKAKSDRYKSFEESIECKYCGIEGEYFAKEKDVRDKSNINNRYHLNLYALKDDKEVLMTKGRRGEGTTCIHCLEKLIKNK